MTRHTPIDENDESPIETGPDLLRDFSADSRLLMLAAMALAVGTMGAGAAWILLRLIDLATNIAYFGRFSTAPVSISANTLGLWSVLVPIAGCLIIGLMARFGSEKIRGHGIPEAMEAILIGRSRIQPKVALLKPLSSAISVGTGGPFGAEGPIIMTGGALGSLFAQLFHLTNSERKTLLVAGASAGMAATFGTPIAAMLLAVELLLFEWKPRSFVPVAVASVVAAGWRGWLLGSAPLFAMVPGAALPATGLLGCVALGIIAGLASGILTAMVYGSEDLFRRLPIHWMWWPLLGGLVIGLGGLVDVRALGVGYDNLAALLHGDLVGSSAFLLLVVKAVIWAFALGSGTSGGVLAPLFIIGGALGALFGGIMPGGESGIWALVGMASMMAGTMRAPLTAMIFAIELTHNTGALLPLAIGCAAAHGTTVLLLKRSILTEKVARRGHHIVGEFSVDPFETTRVRDLMACPVDTLPASMPLRDAVEFFASSGNQSVHRAYPVVDAAGGLIAMVSRADALRWTVEGSLESRLLGEQLAGQETVIGYDDELAGSLADRMAATGAGRIPILRRNDKTVVGLLSRRDLLQVRARTIQHEIEREVLLRPLAGRLGASNSSA